MQRTIFKFIFKYSRREQILLLIMTVVSFPFLYLSLELPKTIINEAIGGTGFPRNFAGFNFEQIPYLLVLCGVFLTLVLINGGFKYWLNVYRGVVGERMLRRLRYDLFVRVLRFPLSHFRKTGQGEVVAMIASETEPLGGFVGDSIALPAFQGGTLLTLLVFMFVQDWVLGLAAVALYPLQIWLIPKLQKQVNLLKRESTIKVRKLSEYIGEIVAGIQEVHAHNTSGYELADYSNRMHEMYQIRYNIYRKKFFIKFLNNFIAQITPFFFFSIGGWLVIKGQLSFGALVAVLAAYKDLSAPWKELLDYYQQQADARIKYELLVDMFEPGGLISEEMLTGEPTVDLDLSAEVVGSNLDLRETDEGDAIFAGNASFRFPLQGTLGIIGEPSSGKDRLALTLAGLKKPAAGTLNIGSVSLPDLPESVTGRQIAYVGQEPRLRAGSLKDNLYYSLMHTPQRPAHSSDAARKLWVVEAKASGNSTDDVNADWIDLEAAGVSSMEELTNKAIEVLSMVDMEETVYQFGLQGTVDPQREPELAARILEARNELSQRLSEPDIAALVEPFDKHKYNTNMSVAENMLFGTPLDASFDLDNLSSNPYVRKVLQAEGLADDFLRIGHQVAEVMVDLFIDVEPGSELFEQFSFISAEDLPDFRSLLARSETGDYRALSEADRERLMAIPFRLVVARHRLGLIDDRMQARLLKARATFERGFGEETPAVEFLERERFNSHVSIQDNILFGRLVYGRARGTVKIGKLVREVVEKLELRRAITEVGLDYPVGIAGSRLNSGQRLKLAIARCILKHPRLLIVDEATAALDETSQDQIMSNLMKPTGRGLVWVLHRAGLGKDFDRVMALESGKVVHLGPYRELHHAQAQSS